RLLAHELAHVVQQGNHSSSVPMPSSISGIFDPLEDEADDAAALVVAGETPQIEHAAGEAGTIYRAPVMLPLVELRGPMQVAGTIATALQASCGRAAPLSWGDFAGNAPARSQFSAETHFHFEQATSDNRQIARAAFDSGTSWVRSVVANAANRAQNGGAAQVRSCEQFFGTLQPGQTGWRGIGAPRGCAAS